MKLSVGCELGYRVDAPSSFVLSIQPTRLEQQRVLRESLLLTLDLPVESHVVTETGNRLVRFRAPASDLTVRYDAEVDLEVRRQDPATVAEIPPAELPFEVLPHLNPSRCCQSDRLPRAAQADFGGLSPGTGA